MLQQTPVARVEPIWRDWLAPLADALRARGGEPGRGAACLGQARLPAQGAAAARGGNGHRGAARRRRAVRCGHSARAARHRRVHRSRGGCVRLPAARGGGGYERATGGRACRARGWRRRTRVDNPRSRGHRGTAAAGARARRGVLGRADGAGPGGLHRAHAALRGLSDLRGLCLAARWSAGVCRAGEAGAEVRRHGPSGARQAAGRAARRVRPGAAGGTGRGVGRRRTAGSLPGLVAGGRVA